MNRRERMQRLHLETAINKEMKLTAKGSTYPYEMMLEKDDLLERIELCFLWGNYQIRVLRWHLVRFSPGLHIPFHKHSEFEFHFIAKGKGTVALFNQHYAYESGMFYVTGPGVVHEQRVNKKVGLDELCLHVDIVKVEDGAREEGEVLEANRCIEILQKFPLFPLIDHFDAMSCFLEAYLALKDGRLGAYTTLKQSVIQILIRSAASVEPETSSFAYPERDLQYHRLQMALHYINDNYNRQITLQEVADRIGLSTRQLQRLFNRYAVVPFSSYVEEQRLQHICKDLISTTDTIEIIAQRHGFQTSNYMYQVFKKKFNMTPLFYRQQHSH